jgi:hypothetical protein
MGHREETYWKCCDIKGDGRYPWELRWMAEGGYAAFSTRSFKKGDHILTERPLVSVSGYHPFTSAQIKEIDEKLAALTTEEQHAFYAMSNVFPEIPSRGAGIFMTNSFDMTDSPSGPACGMYVALARLNHSCCPNVQQTHLPHSGEEVLFACTDIEEGEEINDCYIELRRSTDERRAELQDLFRFTCLCRSCAQDEATRLQEDRMRCRALQIEDQVMELAGIDPATALQVAEGGIVMLESSAGSSSWSVRFIPSMEFSAYQIAQELGRRKCAKQHLERAHSLYLTLQGPDSPETQRSKELLGLFR